MLCAGCVATELSLEHLDSRHPGLLPSTAANYLDAARVCLDRDHIPPTEFRLVHDEQAISIIINWLQADERCRNAWANQDDATRDGAYAVALAAIEAVRGYVAIRRAETHTGTDYYIALSGDDTTDLENCYRLEISGTSLNSTEVKKRLKQKVEQAKRGDSNLPAIAAVIGFAAKLILIQTV